MPAATEPERRFTDEARAPADIEPVDIQPEPDEASVVGGRPAEDEARRRPLDDTEPAENGRLIDDPRRRRERRRRDAYVGERSAYRGRRG